MARANSGAALSAQRFEKRLSMKSTTVLGLLAGVLLGSTSALAADLGGAPARQPRYYEQAEQRDIGPWSGFYLGVAAGYGWG